MITQILNKGPRKTRLALSIRRINLHGIQSNFHTITLMIMLIYNLPP